MTINLFQIDHAMVKEETKLLAVIGALERAVNSEVFTRRFKKLEFSSTKDSNSKVIETISNAAELANNVIDNEMDLWIYFYDQENSVAAGTASPELNRIRLNRYYFNNRSVAQNANTIMHEWLHNLGYKHVTSLDHASVPHRVGDLVERIIKDGKYKYNWLEKLIHQIQDFFK